MNNSEPPSSHEEKWTAYFDGMLSPQDAAAFEREHPEAAAERAMHSRIIGAVRRHSPGPTLRNPDFFNDRIMREIAPPTAAAAPAPAKARGLFSLWRLAFAGAFGLIATIAIWASFVRGGSGESQERYFAQIVSVTAGDRLLDASVLDAEGLKMIWIDGLEPLPDDYALE
jgi:anti-sigma factor RsiW